MEGIDGSGKSLQAANLTKNLQSRGYTVSLIRDPGGPAVSEQIRGIILDRNHQKMDPLTELLLYEAARAQLIAEVIVPALQRNDIVISDRFTDSTVAYQGYGRRIPLELVNAANNMACQDIFPLRTYILDITWEESVQRRRKAKTEEDRMEREEELFFHRVRKGYRTIAGDDPQRVVLLDGMKTTTALERLILEDALAFLARIDHPADPS